ncbi:MAG: DNA polymerase-4 [Planctomycetota bacterium]
MRGRTITLKARYSTFKTVTRTRTLDFPTNLGPRIYQVASELLSKVDSRPLRLLGVQISKLEDVRTPVQPMLFGDADGPAPEESAKDAKLTRAAEGMDRLRAKFGKDAVVPATLLEKGRLKGRDGSDGEARPGDLGPPSDNFDQRRAEPD